MSTITMNKLSQSLIIVKCDFLKIYWHPDYCFVYFDMKVNNLGILRLSEPLQFNDAIKPIALPDEGQLSTGNQKFSILSKFILLLN
jgi:hypothetical protein